MSIAYLLLIKNFLGGYLELGRFIDLAQLDLIAILLWRILRYESWRVKRLKMFDKKEVDKKRLDI